MGMGEGDLIDQSIRDQIDAHVRREVQLEADEKAALAVEAENGGGRVGAAVDLGKGFTAGGHVEKKAGQKIGWFAGLTKRWKKNP
jgi:hypothetical protein